MLEEERQKRIPGLVIKLQTFWRGVMARRFVKRLRAAFIIKQRYKRFKLNAFVNKIFSAFRNVRTDPNMGRNVIWPTPPPVLKPFVDNLKKIQANWRARKIIARSVSVSDLTLPGWSGLWPESCPLPPVPPQSQSCSANGNAAEDYCLSGAAREEAKLGVSASLDGEVSGGGPPSPVCCSHGKGLVFA